MSADPPAAKRSIGRLATKLSQLVRALPLGNRLAGDAAVYVGATVINAAIPFLLLPFLTRWLPPGEFGLVALFLAQINVLQVLIGLGAHGMISVAYFREGPDAMPPQAGAALGIVVTMASTAWIGSLLIAARLEAFSGIPADWLWLVVLASAGQCGIAVALAIFQTLRQPYRFAAVQIGFALCMSGTALISIGLFHSGWIGRALAQGLAAGCVSVVALGWLTRRGAVSWNVRRWPVRAALSFGLPLLPHSLGGVVIASIDRFALTGAAGSIAVGKYFVAQQISSVLLVLGAALSQAWSPWLFERLSKGGEEDHRQVVQVATAAVLLLLAGGLSLAVLAPIVIAVVAGANYGDSVGVLRILGPAYAFVGSYYFVTGFLFYERRTGLLSAITISVAVIQAALSFSLARIGGIVGVAYATLISYALYFALTWFAASRVHPLSWRRFLVRRDHSA